MFEPVPLEMMHADAQSPQVLISVNGIDGVCPSFNCDYAYIESNATITAQSLSNERDLVIEGTNLPVEDLVIGLANAHCDSIVATDT